MLMYIAAWREHADFIRETRQNVAAAPPITPEALAGMVLDGPVPDPRRALNRLKDLSKGRYHPIITPAINLVAPLVKKS